MNERQRGVLRSWPSLVWGLAKREWFSILVWSGAGAVSAALFRLLFFDHLFKDFIVSTYFSSKDRLDEVGYYSTYTATAAYTLALIVVISALGVVRRGLRSWFAGVTSGLCVLSFISVFAVLAFRHGTFRVQMTVICSLLVTWFLFASTWHIKARISAQRTLNEGDFQVPLRSRSKERLSTESDDPIQTWSEDILGRGSLVEIISAKAMIAKSPVIGLFGPFGSGKTSILNLLREHLRNRAIVVSFSTWLPGSQETLTSYLLGDIANECRKKYIVPGLSKSARRLTSALAQSVPYLKGYPELFPALTQRDDVENLGEALDRLPRRVVVLLDDIDRMEEDELRTLLKVIRGVSSLPNLSFVCAAERSTMIRTVWHENSDKANEYFEKFFPVTIDVPPMDADALRKTGIERLSEAFDHNEWFDDNAAKQNFRTRLEGIWDTHISPSCRTLRGIGLLSNDVGTAAALLRREVDPLDLTLVELLRRFKPSVYEIVGRNSLILTEGGEVIPLRLSIRRASKGHPKGFH